MESDFGGHRKSAWWIDIVKFLIKNSFRRIPITEA